MCEVSYMERKDIENVIRQELSMYLSTDCETIDPQKALLEMDEILDSITIIQILVDLESEFEFDFDDEELSMDTLYSIEVLCDIVERHVDR